MKKLIAILVLLIASLGVSSAQYVLAPKYVKGDEYRQICSNVMDMTMFMGDMPMKMHMEQTYDIKYTNKDVKDSLAYIDFSYVGIKSLMKNPMMELAYDSKDTVRSNETLRAVFNPMLNESVTVVVNMNTNKVVKVIGLDGITEKLAKAVNSVQSGNNRDKGMLKSQNIFSPDNLQSLLNNANPFSYLKPVKVGDTWTNSFYQNNNNIKMKYDVTSTLISVEKDKANLISETTITTPNKEEEVNFNGIMVKMDMGGFLNGHGVFSFEKGRTLSMEIQGTLKGTINFSEAAAAGMGEMKMEMAIKSKVEEVK